MTILKLELVGSASDAAKNNGRPASSAHSKYPSLPKQIIVKDVPGEKITIGRENTKTKLNYVLGDSSKPRVVSRLHAELQYLEEEDAFLLVDRSVNGTYVNYARVAAAGVRLETGDVICFFHKNGANIRPNEKVEPFDTHLKYQVDIVEDMSMIKGGGGGVGGGGDKMGRGGGDGDREDGDDEDNLHHNNDVDDDDDDDGDGDDDDEEEKGNDKIKSFSKAASKRVAPHSAFNSSSNSNNNSMTAGKSALKSAASANKRARVSQNSRGGGGGGGGKRSSITSSATTVAATSSHHHHQHHQHNQQNKSQHNKSNSSNNNDDDDDERDDDEDDDDDDEDDDDKDMLDQDEEEVCAADMCRRPIGLAIDWIQCDSCSNWYHQMCLKITKIIDPNMPYFCPKCNSKK